MNRQVRIEHVERLLREVAHVEAGAQADGAGIGFQRAGDHLEQRALPRPVLAHHGPPFAAANNQAEAIVDDARAVALFEVFEHGYLVARARRSTELELHYLALFRQLDLLDLVQRLDAALHLRRLGRVGAESVDEALLLGQHGLLAREGRLLIALANGALALVEIVITRVVGISPESISAILVDYAVHEVAVMRCHEQRAGRGL